MADNARCGPIENGAGVDMQAALGWLSDNARGQARNSVVKKCRILLLST